MIVSELIVKLSGYNQDATVDVIANNQVYPFTLTHGSSDGCTAKNADTVSFYVDELCDAEKESSPQKLPCGCTGHCGGHQSMPYVCDNCRKSGQNWTKPCPHWQEAVTRKQ